MPKPTRKKLSRGAKLTKDHIFDPMTDVAGDMLAAVTQDQLKDGWATFRMSWHLGSVSSWYFSGVIDETAGFRGSLGLPFVLPAMQGEFNTDGVPTASDTPIILEEVTLSFDQRGESVLIADVWTATEGKMSRDAADQATLLEAKLTVALMEKATQCWDVSASGLAEKEVFSLELPFSACFSDDVKIQPFSKDSLEFPMSNYKTYVLSIQAGDLTNSKITDAPVAAINPCLPSFLVTLKFRTKIVTRDATLPATRATQNIPTKHGGALQTNDPLTISAPAGNATIAADPATGVQTNLASIDARLVQQLRGGYNEWSDVFPSEELQVDAAYDVITVPMWHTTVPIVAKDLGVAGLPYVGSTPFRGVTCDRRIIPLKYPVVIQHVVAVSNWAGNLTDIHGADPPYRRPTSANFITTVGVGIGVGMRADNYAYQQVALASWTAVDASKAAFRIDRVQLSPNWDFRHEYDWIAQELMEIPLVHAGNANKGKSYKTGTIDTGLQVFAGKSLTGLNARSNISSGTTAGAYGATAIGGQDQFLEVRWEFKNTVDGLAGAGIHADRIYVGAPGHWVYIFCKRHLA